MYCNACGCELPDQARFCQRCGRRNPLIGGSPGRRRLERPREGRKIAGVCAALANYFNIDPVLMRLIWIVLIFAGGSGVIGYVVGWIIIPEEPQQVEQALASPQSTPSGMVP